MASTNISRRYAEALADALSSAEERTTVRKELATFRKAVRESFDLENLLHNPSVPSNDRLRVLGSVLERMGSSAPTSRFLRLLAERGRMGLFEEIVEAFDRIDDERSGVVRAHITSASELSADTLERLTAALRQRTGRNLEVSADVDPQLIGGFRARVGTLVFDGSIRSELDRLRERLQS